MSFNLPIRLSLCLTNLPSIFVVMKFDWPARFVSLYLSEPILFSPSGSDAFYSFGSRFAIRTARGQIGIGFLQIVLFLEKHNVKALTDFLKEHRFDKTTNPRKRARDLNPSSAVQRTVVLICRCLRSLNPCFLHYIFYRIVNGAALLGQVQAQSL